MTIDVRPIRPEELPAFVDTMSTGFLDRPDVEAVAAELAPIWDLTRAWAAFDGERMAGTLRTWATELTVPGGVQIPASAVTNVTVRPTHRRRGILRSMVAAEHAAARERGEVAGVLYAAEYPIYGRFGYGPACQIATWTVDALQSRFRAPASGTVEFVPPADGPPMLLAVFEAWRSGATGEVRRRSNRWEFDLGLRAQSWGPRWKGFLVVHRDDAGALDGYVRYRTEEKWEQNVPRGIVTVDELHALNDAAYHALWRFIVEIDLVSKVKAEYRPVKERLPWLLVDARTSSSSDVSDGMWVRLFDIPAALAARRYERTGSIVLDVIDAESPDGHVRVALDAGPDGATAAPTRESADLTIGVAALGAAYLGGSRLRDAARADGFDEHVPGALAKADALLHTADEPWCSTFF